MQRLVAMSQFNARLTADAFQALFDAYACDWRAEADSPVSRADVQGRIAAEDWDALVLDGPLQDLVRSTGTIRAASVQLSGGADLVFKGKGATIAVNLFGASAIAHLEHAGYRLGGSRVVVCGTGTRALSLVHAAAVAGAQQIVLVGETPARSKSELELYLSRYKRIAYNGLDLQPSDHLHRSFREAYEQPSYLFGSYTTSTKALAAADYLLAAGEDPFVTRPGVPAHVLGEQILACHAGCAPAESALAKAASDAGLTVLDGRGTLAYAVAQAVSVLCMGAAGTDEVRSESGVQLLDDMFAVAAKPLGAPC